MSHNPTYDPEPGYPSYNKTPEYTNMASYRQAMTGPPNHGSNMEDTGKSYRYATEAIPEDEEAETDHYNPPHQNGSQLPSKTPKSKEKSEEENGFCKKNFLFFILVALIIVFLILFIVFAALYGEKVKGGSPTESPQKGAIGATNVTTKNVNVVQEVTTVSVPTTTPMTRVNDIGDYNNQQVKRYILKNKNGVEVELLSLGARINKFKRNNIDIVLGFDTDNTTGSNVLTTIAKYPYGSANGRICGELRTGAVLFENKIFNPAKSEIQDSFSEGGSKGLYMMNFDSAINPDGSVLFTKTVTEGDDQLPGSAFISVTYTLTDTNQLKISMAATGTANGVIDMCSSTRFNLSPGEQDVTATHQLQINGYQVHRTVWGNITDPTDFRTLKALSGPAAAAATAGLPHLGNAYRLVGHQSLRLAAILKTGGAELKIFTDQPVARYHVQLEEHDADRIPTGKAGIKYGAKSSIAFYTSADTYASSPLTGDSIALRNGETYQANVVYHLA